MRNVLWTGAAGQSSAIFLLDCDGIRQLGQAPVMAQAGDAGLERSRPDTERPGPRHRPLQAGAAGRAGPGGQAPVRARGRTRSASRRTCRTACWSGIETLWRQAARPYGQRPEASQWQQALGNRDEITVSTPQVRDRYPQGVDKAPELRRGHRPAAQHPGDPADSPPGSCSSPATALAQRPSIPVRPPQSPTPVAHASDYQRGQGGGRNWARRVRFASHTWADSIWEAFRERARCRLPAWSIFESVPSSSRAWRHCRHQALWSWPRAIQVLTHPGRASELHEYFAGVHSPKMS